jgi:hypothetical protein
MAGLGRYKGLIFAALLLVAVLTVLLLFPASVRNAAPGFGPDWMCTLPPKGDPICIKQVRH